MAVATVHVGDVGTVFQATIADEHAFDEHALAQATDHGKGADIAARDIAAAIRKGAA